MPLKDLLRGLTTNPPQEHKPDPPAYRCGDHGHFTPTPPKDAVPPWWLHQILPENYPFWGPVHIISGDQNDPDPYMVNGWFHSGYLTLKRERKVLLCYRVHKCGEKQFFTRDQVEQVDPQQTVYGTVGTEKSTSGTGVDDGEGQMAKEKQA